MLGALCAAVSASAVGTIPLPPRYFEGQLLDHFSPEPSTGPHWKQRYYELDTHFGGPETNSPIFVIVGGEGGIAPSTGLFYPWVAEVLAARFNALVVEPEHRFYGESLPIPPPWTPEEHGLLTPQQALADLAVFVEDRRQAHNCSSRPGPRYCPVVTFGGSYPGFLSAMMRVRYPAVVHAAYSASAPVKFYASQVEQGAYYKIVTASAERAVPGCPAAVREALAMWMALPDLKSAVAALGLCEPLPEYITDLATLQQEVNMVVMYSFAGLNMENYPPTNASGMAVACRDFVSSPTLATVSGFLRANTAQLRRTSPRGSSPRSGAADGCFNLSSQLPAGPHATITSGDWSGVGTGQDGESWDFETCTFLVETIGTNNETDMFPPRTWTMDWLTQHCAQRFGVTPTPTALASLWGFDALEDSGASRIIFTNGLNDGWSAGGIQSNLSDTLIALNMPNGAHHSDLAHDPPGPTDTPDVTQARAQAADILAQWLKL